MSHEDPPAPESDARPARSRGEGEANVEPGPALGNVLGFSLAFRARRALLALSRRSLAPGVRLREYEAVLPGVRFPLRGPLNATKFRNYRARVVGSTLAIEDRAVLPWLRERLVGQQLLGVDIEQVELELRRELPEVERPRPCLMLRGHTPAREPIWLLVALDLLPVHRLLVLRPCRLWLVGQLPEAPEGAAARERAGEASVDAQGRDMAARRLWRSIAQRLAAGAIAGVRSGVGVGADDTLTIDPFRLALTRPFASVGWKAPNLEGSAIASLALSRRGLTIELSGPVTDAEPGEEGEAADPAAEAEDERASLRLALDPVASESARELASPVPGELGLLDEPIARKLDAVRSSLRNDTEAEALDATLIDVPLTHLAALTAELHEFPAAHLALVRWRVSISRFLDRPACLEAAREWLDLQPSASEPRRLIAQLLAAEERVQELARLLAAECRQPNPPLTQARLELAVTNLLIDRLDDPRSALAMVGPLTQRLREQIESARDRRARARSSEDPEAQREELQRAHTLAALEATLPEALVALARARVAEVAREGRSLATVPHVLGALDEALEATRNPKRRADLRARVAASFARYGAEHGDDRRGDAQALALLEAAIADDPDNLALIDDAVEVALRSEARDAATTLLARRLELATPDERPSLRKRLIAVAAELEGSEHQQLARRELTLALELEPDNAVLLRRAAVLERKLGDAAAAAEFIARLLELDEAGEVALDDRELLVLDRARLLHRAGRIDAAWDGLRPALALIPEQPEARRRGPASSRERWALDVLELALELAPPTDRPRILDLLIAHARGPRRGQALVERAAQALRVEERLEDLWAAIDEVEQPGPILAQIEQLLDERDFDGLSRLAELSRREREQATEFHARARLGFALLEDGDPASAQLQLERALELRPARVDLRRALADAYEEAGRERDAIPLLRELLESEQEASADARGRLALRLADLLREAGRAEEAAEILARCEQELSKAPPSELSEDIREAVAEGSFAALRELAEDDRAMYVALEQAAALWDTAHGPRGGDQAAARRLGAWLARAARVLDEAGVEEVSELGQLLGSRIELPDALPRTRVALLEAAVDLRPEDLGLAEGLEAVLRELGEHHALEQHLRRQLERNTEPQLREQLVERLIDIIEADEAPEARKPGELAELLEDLLMLRPDHTEAMLKLGHLRHAAGERAEARQLWAMIVDRVPDEDPAFYRPALELAAAALEDQELERARSLAQRAHALDMDALEPLELLTTIAEALDDPRLHASVLQARLELDDTAGPRQPRLDSTQRATLELARADALARLYEREPAAELAAAAVAHYARAEQLLPGREREQDRSSAARRWLALALEIDDPEHEGRARAVLREVLGDDLELDALLAEIELLDTRLGRPLAALELVEWALIPREAAPELLASFGRLLERHVEEFELSNRGQLALRAALRELPPGPRRVAAAELLIEHGRRLDDATTVLHGLDQLGPERVEQSELAQLREWAVRKLGRVDEELGSIESRLASGGLAPERRSALVGQLFSLLDGDLFAMSRRLLELAEQAEREVAATLAQLAVERFAPLLRELSEDPAVAPARLDEALKLGVAGLRSLTRHAGVERSATHWDALETALRGALERELGREALADLIELAGASTNSELSLRANTLLREQLLTAPRSPELLRGLWALAAAAVVAREGELGARALIAEASAWVVERIDNPELQPSPDLVAELFEGLAELIEREVDANSAAAMLREQAARAFEDPPRLAALLGKLRARRRWPELLELLELAAAREHPLGGDPEAWLALAEDAAEDEDETSERRARAHAGQLLANEAGLLGERERPREDIDEALAERAVSELRRALLLDPSQADMRWRLGTALGRLGLVRPAFEQLLHLWEHEQWSAAGVELGELALRCGELASELGEHERAVELLSVAHTRATEAWREYTTEALFSALLQTEDRDTAVTLAGARAAELEDKQASVRWLRRAAELAEGPRKVDLLERARELDPSNERLMAELELELRELGDHGALEQLLRERISRHAATAARAEAEGESAEPLPPGHHAAWVTALEGLIELLEGEEAAAALAEGDEEDQGEGASRPSQHSLELITLYEELLELEPDHLTALMTVAADHYRRERHAEALALWARAEPALDDEDPRVFEVCRRLAQQAIAGRDYERAHELLGRALALRGEEVEVLTLRHEVACALDDPQRVLIAAQALLSLGEPELDPQRQAELLGDVARAELLLERSEAALRSIERAVKLADPHTELHRQLVARWLELLAHPSFAPAANDAAGARLAMVRELDARVELRRGLGTGLQRADALRELDLLLAIESFDRGSELLEQLLIAEPQAAELRARLTALDPESEVLGERGLRALRRVVDNLGAGEVRDELARELALAGRQADAARTTLEALDRLSGAAAAAPDLLDLRVWALRQLDAVEDELSELDALLSVAGTGGERDRVVLDRLMRVLEHDAEACVERLLALAGVERGDPSELADPRTQAWLLESASSLVETHLPERVGLGVRTLTPLLALVSDPQQLLELDADEQSARTRVAALRRSWQQLAARALGQASRERRALEQVEALIRMADAAASAELPGFADLGDMLLDQATVDFPDHVGLHELARDRGEGDSGEALARIERLVEAHRMEPRNRARLYLGLAATLSDDPSDLNPGDSGVYAMVGIGDSPRTPRRKFLRDLAGYHASESAIFSPLREALRKLGAFTELLALFDTVDADPEQWLELADDAAAADDQGAEGAARRRAGLALYERVLAEEREGGGLADNTTLARACEQLGRARELGIEDPTTQYQYGRALERVGDLQGAFAQLEPLVKGGAHKKAGVELGPLARRCGRLAIELGQPERAAGLLHLAYASLSKTRTRIAVAERLFELLSELASDTEGAAAEAWTEQASELAREVAELLEREQANAPEGERGPDPIPWLERAARLARDETERARLYAHAHELAPDDGRLSDLYEACLRELGRHEELEQLLRQRIAAGLQSGDRGRTVAQLERLLALLAELAPPATAADASSESQADELDPRARERAELLEQLLRLAPARLEERLELADLRLREGDREAAAVHWRALAQRLPRDDHRFLAPARALAQFAIDSGELEEARSWLERSLRIDPDDTASLEQLLDVGRGLDLPELVLSTSDTLLERASEQSEPLGPGQHSGPHSDQGARDERRRSRAALLRERATAYERLERYDEALAEIRDAAAVSEPKSDDHIEAARQWLRLATRDSSRVILREEVAIEQARLEVEARAQLRAALGEALPARAYAAEAEALSERLERRDEAMELLLEGLRNHHGDPDLLAAFEELCAVTGQQKRFVASLAELLRRIPSEELATRTRLGEKLARAARAIADPHICLEALEALPHEVSERPELLELRDWAVRGLGNIDDELDRLDARVLDSGAVPERLQALVSRMLRLNANAGEPTARRLLALAERDEVDETLRRALARTALRVAREYAPERLEVALETLRATVAGDTLKAIAAWWPGIESLALESKQLPAILELLELAIGAEFAGGIGYGNRADRLAAAAARLDVGAPKLHVQLLRRAKLVVLAVPAQPTPLEGEELEQLGLGPDPSMQVQDWEQSDAIFDRLFESLDALYEALDLRTPELARMWAAATQLLEQEFDEESAPQLEMRVSIALRDRTVAQVHERDTYAAMLDLLRARECWADVVDLLLWADERYHDLDLEMLEQLAQQAGAAGDAITLRRARIELGVRRAHAGKHTAAAESFAEALAAAEEGWTHDVLQYLYGEMLARAGRADAALEQLLPLIKLDELDELLVVIAEHLGVDQRGWKQRLDKVALARRCGELLTKVDARERAAELFELAFETTAPEDPRRIEIAEQRFEVLVRLGDKQRAAALATTIAGESREHPDRRVAWLLRIAEYGDDRSKIDALADAFALRPSDELAERLERVLEVFGEDQRLAALQRTRLEQARIALSSPHANEGMRQQARQRGAEALRKLVEIHRSEAKLEAGAEPDASLDGVLAELYERMLEFVPDEVEALLGLAASHARNQRLDQAVPLWRRAGEQLAGDDDRFYIPALQLARFELQRSDYVNARALLERAMNIRPGELEALQLQRALAIASDDPELRAQAIEALLEQPEHAGERGELELELAEAHALFAERRGSPEQPEPEAFAAALSAFERAASSAPQGSPLHRQVAEAWLARVTTDFPELVGPEGLADESDPRGPEAVRKARAREAAARAHLRLALGEQLSPTQLRTEASLLALGLGRVDEGLALVEEALLSNPDDALLLSSFKDLCLASGSHTRYAEALGAAIDALPPSAANTRDRLATELAFTAVELDDAQLLLAQLERMDGTRASSPELLDLREWAIRKLGRVESELSEIDQELLTAGSAAETENLVERLLRMLDQDFDQAGQRLVRLASRAEPSVASRLRGASLELARSAAPSYFDVVISALEQVLEHAEAFDQGTLAALPDHWPALEKLALERDEPGLLALLIDLGTKALSASEGETRQLEERVNELRELALRRHPDSPELHALLFGGLETELAELELSVRLERADAAVAELAGRLKLKGRQRARLWVGFASLLNRREGAALLSRRARSEHDDDPVFLAFVDALEHDNHWTRALELLEFRVGRPQRGSDQRQVADLKHLAHLCADILGDPDAAIAHLEAALEFAPEDPDLMLPLLDHYYAQPQLDRAIELSGRVLEHVPMGAVAYAALGHRAADAALATGEHPLAEQLLRQILSRVPDDSRTRDRLRELEQLADDPEHRVRMLAAIANRTAGSARVEALEERARLLIDPLGRLEEAIADLEAVTSEAPGRHAAVTTLADLYEQRQRWAALVTLLEREYPRRQGLERVLTLERIAKIQLERLDEAARAEKSLRLGLENLDSLGVDRLAEQLDERPALRAELTYQSVEPEQDDDEALEADADALFESIVQARKRDPTGANEAASKPPRPSAPKPLPSPATSPAAGPVGLDLARKAWAQLGDRLHLQIVSCLQHQGRYSELIAHLEQVLSKELAGSEDPRERFPDAPSDFNLRLLLMQRLARALRDHVDDGQRTAAVYIRLEQLDALPDEGLATLARWYRGQQRYDDLVRILTVRSRKLADLGDWDRKAEADYRIGELLEGPLRRPHEAARFFLDAYLANPLDNPQAGSRARVLLAGTDSVVNVRNRLLLRLKNLREDYRPALLTLLADLLSPHDAHADEAEKRYRQALELVPEAAPALEGLGRLMSRRGRLEDAVEPLRKAAMSPDIPDERAADDAAAAARALVELERMDEAEAVLEQALERAPESQRALLELTRLYDRLGRKDDEARILERLSGLALSSMLRAEVGYRQAMLLAEDFRADPMSEAGEKARALLLEAVGADAMHAQARHSLLELASARSEWSIVAHMHFLSIRELPPGPRRALTHLDLAETYLDRLSDSQSALRNLGAGLQQAPLDMVVSKRASTLAARLPEPGEAAAKLEQLARAAGRPQTSESTPEKPGEQIDDAGRARLLLLASELHLRNDTLEPAEAAARAATKLKKLPEALRKVVDRALEQIVQIDQGEFDLRKRRKSLHNKLEATEEPVERMQVFTRLRETARALDDREDLEEVTRRQLELAHELLQGDSSEAREAALEALRDVFAESGDYGKIVQLYEDLAGRAGDAEEAAQLLSSAARFAWSGLRDPKLAVAIVRRALDRSPTHAPATELLGEIAGASEEREVDVTICDELSQLAPRQRPPLLTLRLAEAALRLERREQAQTVLRQLLAGEAPVDLRLQALSLLDNLLESDGRTHDRIPLLEERLELCRRHWPDRAADVALELARSQRAVGNLQDARATCRTALLDKPSDQPLTKLYAELLEQAEDWSALARALEQLANLTIETREQAHWLTRAAQVHLDHGVDRRDALAAARRLLERARAISMESTDARALLLPLAFQQSDWERVLELAIELRAVAGDEHEALIYAALTEAFSRGKRTLARSIGDRHDRPVRQRVLWPVCAQMLEHIATDGPLPRLDALLAAAAALCGGTEELLDELGAWAAGQPLRAGLALGLARLNEAFRRMQLARHLYQIAAFMAPNGPVPVLTTRLPAGELPRAPANEDSWVPLEWRGALREVMLQLRETMSGIRGQLGSSRPPRTPKERLAVRHADRIVNAWRTALGADLSIAVTEQKLAAGIGVRNLAKPTIVVSEYLVDVSETERRFRLAYAAAALATGLAIVFDDDPVGVPDLLDALTTLVKPRHEPTTDSARGLVDTLASRGMTASKLDADLRRSLARELDHWRNAPAKLERVLHRACLLFATRLSGNVDGALTAMARDRGMVTEVGKPGDPSVLETPDAAWLLRALGVFGGNV